MRNTRQSGRNLVEGLIANPRVTPRRVQHAQATQEDHQDQATHGQGDIPANSRTRAEAIPTPDRSAADVMRAFINEIERIRTEMRAEFGTRTPQRNVVSPGATPTAPRSSNITNTDQPQIIQDLAHAQNDWRKLFSNSRRSYYPVRIKDSKE